MPKRQKQQRTTSKRSENKKHNAEGRDSSGSSSNNVRARCLVADVRECLLPYPKHVDLGEGKTRKVLPNWIEDAVKQAEASSRGGQVPVVVLHQHGQRYRDALVVMRLKHLERYADISG